MRINSLGKLSAVSPLTPVAWRGARPHAIILVRQRRLCLKAISLSVLLLLLDLYNCVVIHHPETSVTHPGEMVNILSLPVEILHQTASLLPVPDQSALASTCKRLNEQVVAILWREIELHHRGVHEGIQIWQVDVAECSCDDYEEEEEPEEYPFGDCVWEQSARKYIQCPLPDHDAWHENARKREAKGSDDARRWFETGFRATDNGNRMTYQNGRDESLLSTKREYTSASRWAQLAAHVQSLCMSIAIDQEGCELIANLRNLHSLQLVGLPLEEEWKSFDSATPINVETNSPWLSPPSMRYPDLKRLRLRGYFPVSFVREVLFTNASTITHLDLGLLAGPREDKANPILLKEDDSDSGDAEDSDAEETKEPPWSPHSPHLLRGESILTRPLPALTHLHLVKPYDGATYGFPSGDHRELPNHYDEILNQEWLEILHSAASTVKEVVLEHRVVLDEGGTVGDDEGGTVGDGDPRPEQKGNQYQNDPDFADVSFCQSVLCALLAGGREKFPHLRRLALRGIRVRAIPTLPGDISDGVTPGDGDVPSNAQRLRDAFPDCEIELFEPAYPIHIYAGYHFGDWTEDRQEVKQDAGDGLLYDDSFSHDYRRRFGPDWRVI